MSGTGNLKIGHQKEYNDKDEVSVNRHYFTVDSSDGTLRIGYSSKTSNNSNFTVNGTNGDTTIGGKFKVTGSTGDLSINSSNFKVAGSTGTLTIGNGKFTVTGTTGDVTADGTLTASNIKATGGQIGGWMINSETNCLNGPTDNEEYTVSLYPNGTTIRNQLCFLVVKHNINPPVIKALTWDKGWMLVYS